MAQRTKNEVAETVATLPVIPDYNPALETWEDLIGASDQVMGKDLARDELFDALMGVPFLITKVVFRKGTKRALPKSLAEKFGTDEKTFSYASCEAVIAPLEVLKRRRVNTDELPFEPGDQIVFNDGSTGVYRQIVAYLTATGTIELPEPIIEGGKHGECSYDLPPQDWAAVNAGQIVFDEAGWADYTVNVRLSCPRGIRLSEYETDYSPDGGKTRYLG